MSEPVERRTRARIEAETRRVQREIRDIGDEGREQAWVIEEEGLVLGSKGARLYTGGTSGWLAPKVHPVWSDELRTESAMQRAIGEPIINGLPWNHDQAWERGGRDWPSAYAPPKDLSDTGLTREAVERNRRDALPLEVRRQEHEARWAVIEQKLARWGQDVTRHSQQQARPQTHEQTPTQERGRGDE